MFGNLFGGGFHLAGKEYHGSKHAGLAYRLSFDSREYIWKIGGHGEVMVITGSWSVKGNRLTLKPRKAHTSWSFEFAEAVCHMGLPGDREASYSMLTRHGVLILEDLNAGGSGLYEWALYGANQRPSLTT